MKIRFLGAHNIESSNYGMMSLLLDETIAFDAGCITSKLTLEQQMHLKGVLLTHQHYDHTRDIPSLVMNCFLNNCRIDFYCSQIVRDVLVQHYFNGEIHFQILNNPSVHFNIVEAQQPFNILEYKITPVTMKHAVPTQGYYVQHHRHSFLYTGDTGPGLSECWPFVAPNLLIVEVTFPNRFDVPSRQKGHLTPYLLQQELCLFHSIHGYFPKVVPVHMNPLFEKEIANELASIANILPCEIISAYEGMEIST